MITRLKVRNFKSLRNLDLALGPVNVLVGRNMAGKSNIVDALLFIQHFLFPSPGTEGLTYALAERGGVSEVLWKGGNERLLSFQVETLSSDGKESFVYELEIILGVGQYANIQREALKWRKDGKETDLIVQDSGGPWLVDGRGGKTGGGTGGTRSILQHAMPSSEGYSFLISVGSWRFHHFIPALMKRENNTGQGQVLSRYGDNLSAWLMWLQTRSPEVFDRINEVARDVFPGIRSLLTWPSQQGTVHLASQEEYLKQPINVWQMSDGEIVFIALLSLVYTPQDLGPSLLCLEEPENHLHPDLISTLVRITRQVREEIEEAGSPLAQVIVTTQSPYFVDAAKLEEVIWVERKDGETRTVRPDAHAHLRKLIADKELGLGDIVYSGLLQDSK